MLLTGWEYVQYVTGQRKLIARQLSKKFGPLSIEQQMKVTFWPVEKLEELAFALLDAKSLDELGLGEPAPVHVVNGTE